MFGNASGTTSILLDITNCSDNNTHMQYRESDYLTLYNVVVLVLAFLIIIANILLILIILKSPALRSQVTINNVSKRSQRLSSRGSISA